MVAKKEQPEPCKTCGACPTCGKGPVIVQPYLPPVVIQSVVSPNTWPFRPYPYSQPYVTWGNNSAANGSVISFTARLTA